MRWKELLDFGESLGLILPTYRQIDVWTRAGHLTAEMRGDRHGQYRWWPWSDVEAALMVAYLVTVGVDAATGFAVARGAVAGAGSRSALFVGPGPSSAIITVSTGFVVPPESP